MVSIRIKRPQAVVQHPHIEELMVTIQEPSRASFLEWRSMLMDYTKPLVNPETKEIVRLADGTPEMAMPNIPAPKLHQYLARNMVKVEGIEERDAKMEEIAKAFLERDFDCTIEKDGKEFKQAFALYLLDKINSDGTFQGVRPLETTSA